MIVTIRFSNQYNSEDVNRCIDDIESSGGEAIHRSYLQDENYVDVDVNIIDVQSFDQSFKLTESFQFSNY